MEDSDGSKLIRKMKEDPVVPIGLAGMIGICAYGAYSYKSARKVMSLSAFLTQLRVVAQTAVVGCITLSMVYSLGKNLLYKDEPKKN